MKGIPLTQAAAQHDHGGANLGRCPSASTVLLCLTLIAGCGTASSRPAPYSMSQTVEPTSLLARDWSGKTWPLHDQLRAAVDTRRQRWLIVIAKPDCQHCRELLEQTRPALEADDSFRKLLLIADQPCWRAVVDSLDLCGKPEHLVRWASRDPFVASPAVYLVEEGTVSRAADGAEADGFLTSLCTPAPTGH